LGPIDLKCVSTVESYADGQVSREEAEATREAAISSSSQVGPWTDAPGVLLPQAVLHASWVDGSPETPASNDYLWDVMQSAQCVARAVHTFTGPAPFNLDEILPDVGESRQQAALLRDIIGNPFQHVTIDPTWRTGTVTKLAQAIYDERAFDRMPILADALEEAGCTDATILDHCRQPGEHVRGCWLVDLLLGKK
jgi:hypothetical protein